MPPLDQEISECNGKFLLIGDNGAGKTGSLAPLVCEGYRIRMLDTDKGFKPLRSLLLDERYPYAKIIKMRKINVGEAVHYVPIDIPMSFRQTTELRDGKSVLGETLLAPTNNSSWIKAVNTLAHWKEGNVDLGKITSWGSKDVLVIDSFSTLAKMAYYYIQGLNGRLGARDTGYDYQRDIGDAQQQLTRLLEMLSNDAIKCNVIIISHITRIDSSQGFSQSPEQRSRDGIKAIDAKGHPSAIGRALSSQMGKYFNDIYSVEQSGSGTAVKRQIHTVPTNNVSAKNSIFLKKTYDVSTGLAEIMAEIHGEPEPTELIEMVRANKPATVLIKASDLPTGSLPQKPTNPTGGTMKT